MTLVETWLLQHARELGPVLPWDLTQGKCLVFDFSAQGIHAGMNESQVFAIMAESGAQVGIGRYNEDRAIYTSPAYKDQDSGEWRTVHLGIDLMVPVGTSIRAPIPGRVHSFSNNAAPLDYGPTIVLEHQCADPKITFYTLYGHLALHSLETLAVGDSIAKGQTFAHVGDSTVNGGWAPHLHLQIITDMLGNKGGFPGVARASERSKWLKLCPDPNLILQLPESLPLHS